MKTPRISAIAAIGATTRALGKGGDLLFKIPEDLAYFRSVTKGRPVIMGRKTWESLPDTSRPLPGRANIVITRQKDFEAIGAAVVPSVEEALAIARASEGADEIFVIGGGEIYREAMPHTSRLYLTLVDDDTLGDVEFPPYEEFTVVVDKRAGEHKSPPITFLTLERP